MNGLYDIYTDDGPDETPVCPVCGSEDGEWVECPECGGKGGYDEDDLMDDDPLWYAGVEWEPCSACHGDGGWFQCWSSDQHPKEANNAA